MAQTIDIAGATTAFLADIRMAYGEEVTSVIRYGAAAHSTVAGTGGIQFMVIMTDNSPSELAKCAGHLKKWSKQGIALPLFLADDYIARSLDTFPLEFMAMQASYEVVAGDDVLLGLSFDPADVRNQCERELKGKLIHLRAEYLTARGNTKALMDLVKRSLSAFTLEFTGVLWLRQIPVPGEVGDLVAAVCESYGLDSALFVKLAAIARGEIKINGDEADDLFDQYVEELMNLSRSIDALNTLAAADTEPLTDQRGPVEPAD